MEVLKKGPWRQLKIVPDTAEIKVLAKKWPLRGANLWHLATAKTLQRELSELLVLTFDNRLYYAANLTAATNVIHYDLWWNPTVEEQATDRTYRIGQTKKVLVHRLITIGTFKEKIDEMISAKKELAELTISAGEQ
jgi:hypothetical protein